MATINVTQWAGQAKLPGSDVSLPMGFLKGENVTVTTAQKYELEADTRIVELVDIAGGAYARSGNSGSADIVVGGGQVVDTSLGIPLQHILIEEVDHTAASPRLLMIAR